MMRQQFGSGRNGVGKLLGQHLGDLLMVVLPGALQQRLIGHLLGEGVLEGVDVLGEELQLVEELGGLQVGEAPAERLFGLLGDGLEERRRGRPYR